MSDRGGGRGRGRGGFRGGRGGGSFERRREEGCVISLAILKHDSSLITVLFSPVRYEDVV